MSTVEPHQPHCGEEMATGTTSATLVVGCHYYHHHYFHSLSHKSYYLCNACGWHHCHFHSLSKYLTPTLILQCLWLVVTIFVSPQSFSVSFTFSQIKSQCLRPLLQNERDKSTSSEAKEAPGEF